MWPSVRTIQGGVPGRASCSGIVTHRVAACRLTGARPVSHPSPAFRAPARSPMARGPRGRLAVTPAPFLPAEGLRKPSGVDSSVTFSVPCPFALPKYPYVDALAFAKVRLCCAPNRQPSEGTQWQFAPLPVSHLRRFVNRLRYLISSHSRPSHSTGSWATQPGVCEWTRH